MKIKLFVLIVTLLNFDIFAHEGIKTYMLSNNENYPYNVSLDINKVEFSGWHTDDILLKRKFKEQQRDILIPFFEKLNSISNPEYFSEFKNIPNVTAFSIDSLHMVRHTPYIISIRIGVTLYFDTSPGKFAQYNEEYNFWRYFDIAVYSVNDPRYLVRYKYLGFLFGLHERRHFFLY
jgi:hypothetical protein